MRKQGSMILSKEHNNSSELDAEMKDTFQIPEIKFKIIITRKLNPMQESTDRQLKEIRKSRLI